jgi:HAD superfamily hydrolase (TIGR01509 family)
MTGLASLLATASVLLLDFDGPVCRLFAGYPAPTIADQLRGIVTAHGYSVSADMANQGPHGVLRLAADLGDPDLTGEVTKALRQAEVQATATAEPTPGLTDLLHAAQRTGRRVAIVSNNAVEAVHAYLARHQLAQAFSTVIGRADHTEPHQLKPSPFLVNLALRALDVAPTAAILVGDSASDIQAAHAAGVLPIGFANKPGKREAMTRADARQVIDDLVQLADSLHDHRP